MEGFGYPYWAGYQLLVVIILLSVLRARMINTYQNIRQEADTQWKFFRANLWWNYLEASLLPPPFTITDGTMKLIDWLTHKIVQTVTVRRTPSMIDREASRRTKLGKTRHQKYQKLLFVLLTEIGDGQDDDKAVREKLENFENVRIEVAFD